MDRLHPLMRSICEAHGAPKPANTYRDWTISYDPPPIPMRDFDWSATGPNYDASWEGEEDGWVSNGEQVTARTREALIEEIDAFLEDADEDNADQIEGFGNAVERIIRSALLKDSTQ